MTAPPGTDAGTGRRRDVIASAISPWPDQCAGAGYGNGYLAAYITVITLTAVTVPTDRNLGPGLMGILGFDAAQGAAGIGDVNSERESSFCGPDGLVWGLDAVPHPQVRSTRTMMLRRHDGADVPVWPLSPLLDAGRALLARFPLRPGAFVKAAYKEIVAEGPCLIGACLAYGVPADPVRHAGLLMEDPVYEPLTEPYPGDSFHLRGRIQAVAQSVLTRGAQRGTAYAEVFAGAAAVAVPEGHTGGGLVYCPYVHLAGRAVPPEGPAALVDMPLPDWQQLTGPPPP